MKIETTKKRELAEHKKELLIGLIVECWIDTFEDLAHVQVSEQLKNALTQIVRSEI